MAMDAGKQKKPPVLNIPHADTYTMSIARVPKETLVGICDASALQIEHRGRVWQQIDPQVNHWLDMASGEIVTIALPSEGRG